MGPNRVERRVWRATAATTWAGDARPAAVAPLVVNLALATALARGRALDVLAVAVVLPVLAAVVARPQRGMLLLAALAPFHGLLLVAPLPAGASGWKEALVLLTVGATFVCPAAARAPARRRFPGWAAGVAALLAVGSASALVVGGIQGAVGLKVLFFYVLVAVAAWRCPLDERERDLLVTILMAAGVVTAAIGIAQQVLGAEHLNALGYEYNTTIRTTGGFLRSFSTFNQPFGFGFFLMLVLLLGIPQAFAEPRRWRNRLFVLSLPVLGLGLVLTFVRGAWIGLALGLAYIGWTRHRSLLLAIPLVAVSLPFLPADVAAPALSPSSSVERVSSWGERLSEVGAHPVGAGIGATGSASEKVASLRGRADVYQPDNYYFKILLELGVVGLWLLLLVLLASFLSARDTARRLTSRDGALALGVAAMTVAAAGASVVATYFEIFPMDVYFWLLLAVVATCVPASR